MTSRFFHALACTVKAHSLSLSPAHPCGLFYARVMVALDFTGVQHLPIALGKAIH